VYRDRGSKTVKSLKSLTTDSLGYLKFKANYKKGRRWQLRWSNFGGHFVEAY
jgi:hypothetical protein